MESPHRSRFIVSVEQDYALPNFVAVITCSDDVPRMHLLAELPQLGSVATGAIAGLFMRKLELCCLQVRPSHRPASSRRIRCRVPCDVPPSQFDFTIQEDPNSAFERIRQKKREVLIEIYKYLEAVSPQSPLPFKLLQQLLVMIQANTPIANHNACVSLCNAAAAVQHPASAARHSTRAAHSRGRR